MEKKQQVSYPADLDLSKYEIRFWVEGNCMDAPEAPMRLKDGQRLQVHELECDDGVFHIYRHIEEMRGKVCAIISKQNGKRYCVVKEVVGLDELTGCLRLAISETCLPATTTTYNIHMTTNKTHITTSVVISTPPLLSQFYLSTGIKSLFLQQPCC